ncbi:MAG: hypothetical protein ACR2FG_12785 [Marmoricola sp.]
MQITHRRRIAGAALALALPALAGCGFNQQTDKAYQPATGTNDRNSQVDVLGAVVVSATPGSGAFIVSLVNKSTTTADQLTGVQGASGTQVATGDTPQIPADGLVNLATTSAGGIPVTGDAVKAGGYVTLQLSFKNADPVTLAVPVVTDSGAYGGLVKSMPSPLSPAATKVAAQGSTGALSKAAVSPSAKPTKPTKK